MILLQNLSAIIKAKGTTEVRLADITNIDRKRLHNLIYPSLRAEAWFDEAVAIAHAVGVAGILPLIGASTLAESPGLPPPLPNDLDMLRGGVRLPLGLACNIAIKLGLSDPIDLVVTPLTRELWRIMSAERNAICPWCLADDVGGPAHLPTCYAETLWGDRGAHVVEVKAPALPRKNAAGGSLPGLGLRSIRERMGKTQEQMAKLYGTEANGYAQLERCTRPLTNHMARRFSQASGIDRELFFLAPDTEV